MAGEILFSYIPSRTCYAFVFNSIGQIWNTNTTAFESYNTANIANYAISTVGQGSASTFYEGTFPSLIPAGVYPTVAKQQIGGSVAESDPTIATGDIQWNGSVVLPLSNLATSGQVGSIAPIRIARSWMVQNFPIYLKMSADHVTPLTSGILSGQISRDGGAFTNLQSGKFSEVGLGFYALQSLTSGDLAANSIALLFTANGVSGGQADPLAMSFITQRVSGF
jgi:hypothetical protein